ncbi:hypothetical protein [Fontivita pretiosa]|uniref:hypothetical protein n=1 Tax=Fontivita pretiosa TaxID=2989684 RepID=UPI003D1787E1
MNPEQTHFDDPALKAALRRALGGETAPPQLRERIAQALRAERAAGQTQPTGQNLRRWRTPLYGLAAAAALLLGLGLVYSFFWNTDRSVPPYFATAMVEASRRSLGEDRARNAEHGIADPLAAIPATDLAAARAKLLAELRHPVLVIDPGDGWTFQGASLSEVGGTRAARFVFTRGDATICVYSLSTGALGYRYKAKDGMTYAQTDGQYHISGFVRDGAVHCVVGSSGSGNLTLRQVTALRNQIRKAAQTMSMGSPSESGGCATSAPAS